MNQTSPTLKWLVERITSGLLLLSPATLTKAAVEQALALDLLTLTSLH
jgi:hypothetical protein